RRSLLRITFGLPAESLGDPHKAPLWYTYKETPLNSEGVTLNQLRAKARSYNAQASLASGGHCCGLPSVFLRNPLVILTKLRFENPTNKKTLKQAWRFFLL